MSFHKAPLPVTDPLGLYVHVPFCLSKCSYCDFYSITDTGLATAYTTCVASEIPLLVHGRPRLQTLYIGGGSPSVLSASQLTKLLGSLQNATALEPDAEFTIECNPADVDRERLGVLGAHGVNRISLGLQSLDDARLALMGRRHDRKSALAAIDRIRTSLGDRVALSLDLIFGLPGQALQGFLEELQQVIALRPEHLSLYELTLAPGTPLTRRILGGELASPGEDTVASMFLEAHALLASQGFVHYEVSNYARGADHESRHNWRYWLRQDTLGLGPGAHGLLGSRRYANKKDLNRYLESIPKGERVLEFEEHVDSGQARLEELALGLRTREGILQSLAEQFPGAVSLCQSACAEGLLEIKGQRFVPTARGLLVADGMARRIASAE